MYELQVGDEILYRPGPNLKYGAIQIEVISMVPGSGILLQYDLPRGAFVNSSENIGIAVFWEEEQVLIQISQHLSYTDRVLIRRK